MDLLGRYLNAVKFWLPANQQDDIIAELSEDLRSQVEDREAMLGRDLTQEDWKELLKKRGHPMLVATGYLPQRYLIGPVLFPLYLFVLKIALLCCFAPIFLVRIGVIVFMLTVAGQQPHESLFGAFWASAWPTLITFIPVTFAFALLERYQRNWLELWSPDKLPKLSTQSGIRRIPRSSSIFELIITLMFCGWTISALITDAVLEQPGVRIAMTSTGRYLIAALLLSSLAAALITAVHISRPYWTRRERILQAAIDGVTALFYALCLGAQPLVDISGSKIPDGVNHFVNLTISAIAFAAVLISSAKMIFGLWRASRGANTHSSIPNSLGSVL